MGGLQSHTYSIHMFPFQLWCGKTVHQLTFSIHIYYEECPLTSTLVYIWDPIRPINSYHERLVHAAHSGMSVKCLIVPLTTIFVMAKNPD